MATLAPVLVDAVGIRLHEAPFSPDRVLDALFRKERAEKSQKAKEVA